MLSYFVRSRKKSKVTNDFISYISSSSDNLSDQTTLIILVLIAYLTEVLLENYFDQLDDIKET